jgi:hypothetical protein
MAKKPEDIEKISSTVNSGYCGVATGPHSELDNIILLEYAKNILKRWGATINEHYCYRRST